MSYTNHNCKRSKKKNSTQNTISKTGWLMAFVSNEKKRSPYYDISPFLFCMLMVVVTGDVSPLCDVCVFAILLNVYEFAFYGG